MHDYLHKMYMLLCLLDEFVDIELIQLSNAHEGGKLLASFYSNARDFLYPYPTYSTNYGARDREILLDRSIEFPVRSCFVIKVRLFLK